MLAQYENVTTGYTQNEGSKKTFIQVTSDEMNRLNAYFRGELDKHYALALSTLVSIRDMALRQWHLYPGTDKPLRAAATFPELAQYAHLSVNTVKKLTKLLVNANILRLTPGGHRDPISFEVLSVTERRNNPIFLLPVPSFSDETSQKMVNLSSLNDDNPNRSVTERRNDVLETASGSPSQGALRYRLDINDKDKESIGEILGSIYTTLGDTATLNANVTKAVNLYVKSGKPLNVFTEQLKKAFDTTKRELVKVSQGTRKKINIPMGYFFSILDKNLEAYAEGKPSQTIDCSQEKVTPLKTAPIASVVLPVEKILQPVEKLELYETSPWEYTVFNSIKNRAWKTFHACKELVETVELEGIDDDEIVHISYDVELPGNVLNQLSWQLRSAFGNNFKMHGC